MERNFSRLVKCFSNGEAGKLLLNGRWGIEKEALRVQKSGELALTPHPEVFGDKMENPCITTDFSESQIELITPALPSVEETFRFLYEIQTFTEQTIGQEFLWPLSIPGSLPDERNIPLASYNSTSRGREKEIYRSGLALRYGKAMQMISGIHYNFSFGNDFWDFLWTAVAPEEERQRFIDETYLGVARNFIRYRWLLIYLFGASPLRLGETENVSSQAISYRMSRFGYENAEREALRVSFNSVSDYVRDLRKAISTTVKAFSELGVYRDGRQVQLNDCLLQSENEYYCSVRLKQQLRENETHLSALEKRGIDYLEIRAFDLDPFQKTGIGLEQLHFTQVFLLFCLFEEREIITDREMNLSSQNAQNVALRGRVNDLELRRLSSRPILFSRWSKRVFRKITIIAELLDRALGKNVYSRCVTNQKKKVEYRERLPSTRILNTMRENGESYQAFGLRKARENTLCSSYEKRKAS